MVKVGQNILALDSETTGTDCYHGSAPYLVTFCDPQWNNIYFEWRVDPLTRRVKVPPQDAEEIASLINGADLLVLQNAKFDVAMLMEHTLKGYLTEWPWRKTHDTLVAAHLLASNHAKDLASLAIEFLGISIDSHEAILERAVQACRTLVRRKDSPIAKWRIAKAGLPEMPSAKERVWKYDTWLPREVALHKVPDWDRSWLTVAQTYANCDSATTLALYQEQVKHLKHRGLWRLFLERMKWVKEGSDMERRGVTLSRARHAELLPKYKQQSADYGQACINIANSYDYPLTLPKAGSNKSLTTFIFDHLQLPPIYSSKSKTGAPSLDKNALEEYKLTLPDRSKGLRFVTALRGKRKLDTSIGYGESYEKFWLPYFTEFPSHDDTMLLHSSLNPTGTDTLRWSSNNPNQQQISKQEDEEGFNLRYLFGPAPGWEWWSMDAKNIELRIPAYECREEELIQLFENADSPPYYGSEHLLNFSTVYPDIWDMELRAVGLDKVGPHCKKKYASTWYQRCKNGDFAVGYGAVDRPDGMGTADKTFGRPGSHARLKERFAKKEQLNQHYINMANERGYVETLPDRTVDPDHGYPLLCSRGQWGKVKPTIPLNYHVQGTACWVLGRAMVLAADYLRQHQGHLVLQVHDELVFALPFKANHGNLPIVMELKAQLDLLGDDLIPRVPIVFGVEYHSSTWSVGETFA